MWESVIIFGMNTTAKGNRVEALAKKLLVKDGWLVETKNKPNFRVRTNATQDFWNEFDLLAIRGSETRLVQVKSNPSGFYTARKQIRKWVTDNNIKIKCEVWLYIGRNKWRQESISALT